MPASPGCGALTWQEMKAPPCCGPKSVSGDSMLPRQKGDSESQLNPKKMGAATALAVCRPSGKCQAGFPAHVSLPVAAVKVLSAAATVCLQALLVSPKCSW